RELQLVSQQVSHLKQECEELKKDRDDKEQQLRSVTFNSDVNHNEHGHQDFYSGKEHVIHLQDHHHISHHFQNASTSLPQTGPKSPFSEAKNNHRTTCARRGSEKLACDGINVSEGLDHPSSDNQLCGNYGLKGKSVQADGLSVKNDLRSRTSIDSGLTISNECTVQAVIPPETTAQPKYTRAVGVQTDTDTAKSDLHSQHLLDKFSAIWGLPTNQRSGKSLVPKLLMICAADFYALFRCMGMNMPSTLESLDDLALHDKLQCGQSAEAAKVAHLYLILTKVNNEMLQLDILIKALIELCTIDNVIVVHKSLRIVRVVLQYVLDLDARSYHRDNVVIEGMAPRNNTVEICNSQKGNNGVQFGATKNRASFLGSDCSSIRSFDLDTLSNEDHGYSSNIAFISALEWMSLFESMHQIAIGNKEEYIKVEAISVMNLILMKSHPCLEREKFGSSLLFESLSRLLQKDFSLHVQMHAVRLLFLLLNCPKILVLFCSACKDESNSEAAVDSSKNALTFQGFNTILEGLAECIKCRGHGTQVLKLRRLAIKVLAFVASSGKSCFEVLLNQTISKGYNFLEVIMQALASEMDADAVESTEPSESSKERTSLIREALILLNRLASSPAYSGAVLQVLTSSRDMVSLTIDVVNRMSRKETDCWKSNGAKKRKAEDEIVDLARVFRSRVFTYLGNTVS
ncbi:Dimerizations protein, partial [Thalictrum thalictroides]